jgi:glycosyltransferase involved in cell wall biosynthesis
VGEEHGAVRLVPPCDSTALREVLAHLTSDAVARTAQESRAAAAASGPYSWDEAARLTLALYEELLSR